MNRILFWIRNARITALPQSILPAIVAAVIASSEASFSAGYALLAIIGIIFAHLSCNLFDDYFDYKKKGVAIRNQMTSEGFRARIGKCTYITSGQASLAQLRKVALLFGLCAAVCGLFVTLRWGWLILAFALVGAILGYSYSGPPFRFSYHGMGEIIVALLFGPCLMSGLFFASSGIIPDSLWVFSVPIGLLAANILYTHDIMDFEADKKSGKKTLCVLLNNKIAIYTVAALFIFFPYITILLGVLISVIHPLFLLTYLTFPLAFTLFYLLVQFSKNPYRKFHPGWWMMPMEKWESIERNGIDWFMIRWYLARNILMYFCILIIIAHISSNSL